MRNASSLRWLWRVALLPMLAFALAACAEQEPLTAIVVVVDSNIGDAESGVGRLDEVRVDVDKFGDNRPAGTKLEAGKELPLWLGLVHRGGEFGPITVTATGKRNGVSLVIVRRARVYFEEHQVKMLRLNLLEQ
jgi:hypothetical protein